MRPEELPDLPLADKGAVLPVIAGLTAQATGDDRRVDGKMFGGRSDLVSQAKGSKPIPLFFCDEGIHRELISVPLDLVFGSCVDVRVEKAFARACAQVFHHMAQFVEKREPEIVEPIIAESETDHWKTIRVPHCGTIEVRSRQLFLQDERDSDLHEPLPNPQRPVGKLTQGGELPDECLAEHSGVVARQVEGARKIEHAATPGVNSVYVHL